MNKKDNKNTKVVFDKLNGWKVQESTKTNLKKLGIEYMEF
jgi:hypothetical protein